MHGSKAEHRSASIPRRPLHPIRATFVPQLGAYNRRMSIRSWFAKRRQQADAEAVERAKEEAVESAQEREISRGNRWGEAADTRVARRAGEANISDVDRLGDF